MEAVTAGTGVEPTSRSASVSRPAGAGAAGVGARAGVGPRAGARAWGWGYGPGWYAPAYAYPPAVVEQPAPQYIERQDPTGYWYFCPSAGDYYPRVQSCSEPWQKVAPAPE